MKLRRFIFAFVLVGVFVGAAVALDLDFRLINKTGKTMYRLYMNPSEFSKWNFDDDEISGEGLPIVPGDYANVSITDKDRLGYRLWDMRAYFRDGEYWEYHNINLSRISSLTLNVDGRAVDNLGKYYNKTKNRTR